MMDYEISEMAAQLEAEINPDAMSEDELQGIVGKELEDAIDYADNYVSPLRATATPSGPCVGRRSAICCVVQV